MRLSILIDFHNLFMMLGKDADQTKSAIAEIMKMGRKKGEISEARLFVPIYFIEEESKRIWRFINTLLLTFGLEVEACAVSSIVTDLGRKMKDSVDNGVMMHIVRNVHKDIGPELIVFVTGDGDFVKFSTLAQNKSKQTEFWSVDSSSTNRFIRQEGNFREIEAASAGLQENLFLAALNSKIKHLELTEEEKQRLELVARLADLQLQGCQLQEMSILIAQRLDISHAESDWLLEMLTILGIAEVTLAATKVVDIDYFHSLFSFIRHPKPEKVIP